MRHFLFAFVLLFVATVANAQPKGRGFRGVITAGLNASQIDGDGLSGFDEAGFVGGFAAIFDLNDKFAIGPEFMYSQMGSRTKQKDEGRDVNPVIHQLFRTNYAQIPVLAHYRFVSAAGGRFSACLGPSFNLLLKARAENGDNDAVITSRWRPVDFGGLVGIEADIIANLSFAARWYYSLLPANAGDLKNYDPNQIIVQGAGLRNNTIQVMLRYSIGGGQTKVSDTEERQ